LEPSCPFSLGVVIKACTAVYPTPTEQEEQGALLELVMPQQGQEQGGVDIHSDANVNEIDRGRASSSDNVSGTDSGTDSDSGNEDRYLDMLTAQSTQARAARAVDGQVKKKKRNRNNKKGKKDGAAGESYTFSHGNGNSYGIGSSNGTSHMQGDSVGTTATGAGAVSSKYNAAKLASKLPHALTSTPTLASGKEDEQGGAEIGAGASQSPAAPPQLPLPPPLLPLPSPPEDLLQECKEMLIQLASYQQAAYLKDPTKTKTGTKHRLTLGLKQVTNSVKANHCKFVFLAPGKSDVL
jgi:hypothetical protein